MRRTEIGSEFWDVPAGDCENRLFDENTDWFLCGRSALAAVIAENDFTSAALPDYCCESMILPFLKAGIRVEFYPAFERMICPQTDVVLVMDHFGFHTAPALDGYSGAVIYDETHSLLTPSFVRADYTIGSLRKWAGFLTGGYAKGLKKPVKYQDDTSQYTELRRRAMREKEAYITGKREDKGFLSLFEEAEQQLSGCGIVRAEATDIEKAKKADVGFIAKRRRENAAVLTERLSDIVMFRQIEDDETPMFVSVTVDERDKLRRFLIRNEVYCPVHWPKPEYCFAYKNTSDLYKRELSLVCDQRYGTEDMTRICDLIQSFLRRNVV